MALIISSSQVDSFRALIREFEPYPLEVLENLMIDDDRYDENRINATIAKKMLIDCGIPLECENPNNESDNRQTNNDHQSPILGLRADPPDNAWNPPPTPSALWSSTCP